MKRVVVAERFVVDSIASIAYFLGDVDFMKSWQAQFLLKLTPKGTIYIFIDADYDTILQRRGQAAGPRDYTNFHRSIYSALSKRVNAYYANTAKDSVQDVNREILHFVYTSKSSS
jgi:thymidylate kinase